MHLADHLGDVDGLVIGSHLPGLNFGEVEDVVDEREQVLAGAADLLQVLRHARLPVLLRVLQQDLAVADDRVHRRAQLVAHVSQEGALGPAGLLRRLLRFLKVRVGLLELARAEFDLAFH